MFYRQMLRAFKIVGASEWESVWQEFWEGERKNHVEKKQKPKSSWNDLEPAPDTCNLFDSEEDEEGLEEAFVEGGGIY